MPALKLLCAYILGIIQHHRMVGKEQGSIERHCCRPIQKGYQQAFGRDLR